MNNIAHIKVIVTDDTGHEDIFLDVDTPGGAQVETVFETAAMYFAGRMRPLTYYTGEKRCIINIPPDLGALGRALAEAYAPNAGTSSSASPPTAPAVTSSGAIE